MKSRGNSFFILRSFIMKHNIKIQPQSNGNFVISLADCIKNINNFCLNSKEPSDDNIKTGAVALAFDLQRSHIVNFGNSDLQNFTGNELISVREYIDFLHFMPNNLNALNTNKKTQEYLNTYNPIFCQELITELQQQQNNFTFQKLQQTAPIKPQTMELKSDDLFAENNIKNQQITPLDIINGKAMFDLQIQPDEIEQDRFYVQEYNGKQVRIKVEKNTHNVWVCSVDVLGKSIHSHRYINSNLEQEDQQLKFLLNETAKTGTPICLYQIKDAEVILNEAGKESSKNFPKILLYNWLNSTIIPKRVINKYNWQNPFFKIDKGEVKISVMYFKQLFLSVYKMESFLRSRNILKTKYLENLNLYIDFFYVVLKIKGMRNRHQFDSKIKEIYAEYEKFKKANQHLLKENVTENKVILPPPKAEVKAEISQTAEITQPPKLNNEPLQEPKVQIAESIQATTQTASAAEKFIDKYKINFLAFLLGVIGTITFFLI